MLEFLYPIFVRNGETLDLRTILSGTTFAFRSSFVSPSWLTLSSDTHLVIAADAVSEITPVIVQLNDDRSFYLVVMPSVAPIVQFDGDTLAMLPNSTFDMFSIVENVDSITLQSGPTGSSISNGVLTVGTVGGTAALVATNAAGTTQFSIVIDVVADADVSLDTFRYSIEIAGIDVSGDFLGIPTISGSLDAIRIDEYRVNNAEVVLSDDAGKYNSDVSGNFWEQNNLNENGYNESIKIYKETVVNGVRTRYLQFSGFITQTTIDIQNITISLSCVDDSSVFRNQNVGDAASSEKWDVLTQDTLTRSIGGITYTTVSDYSGRIDQYHPHEDLLPMHIEDVSAWIDSTPLEIQTTFIPDVGELQPNIAQITPAVLRRQGSIFENILTRFQTPDTHRDIAQLIKKLVLKAGLYQVDIDVDRPTLETPYILNRGNMPLRIENTRPQRTAVDWEYDATDDTLMILMASDSPYIKDWLVQHNIKDDTYKILHAFESGLNPIRIARLNNTTYYLLISETFSSQFTSNDQKILGAIYQYATDTQTLTERVSTTDDDPPLPTTLYRDANDNNVRKNIKSTFKCIGNTLYYAADDGVCRLGTSGAPQNLGGLPTSGDDRRHFVGFAINDDGDIYTLNAARFPGGVNEFVWELRIDRRLSSETAFSTLYAFSPRSSSASQARLYDAFLSYELLIHGNALYILYSNLEAGDRTRLDKFIVSGNSATFDRQIIGANADGPTYLFLHENKPHFMYNADVGITTLNNAVASTLGGIRRIESDGSVTDLGPLYKDGLEYWQRAVIRPLSISRPNPEIHTMMGESKFRIEGIHDILYLVYGTNLNFVLASVDTRGNIYDILRNLAVLMNATLSFEKNVIRVQQRKFITAAADGAIGDPGTANIAFDNETKDFPSSGFLRIDNEFIEYTGVSSNAFTGIGRGVAGTAVSSHADAAQIIYVDSVFSELDLLENITIRPDVTRVYNVIRNSSGTLEVRDTESIEKYGERVYTLSLPYLTDSQWAWQNWLLQQYLDNLKDLKYLVNVKLRPTTRLSLGDIIGIKYAELVYAVQITSITDGEAFDIQGRTV